MSDLYDDDILLWSERQAEMAQHAERTVRRLAQEPGHERSPGVQPAIGAGRMSYTIERMREELIKAMAGRSVVIRRQCDMTDLAEAEPEKSLPDVPLHQRGFGVVDEDVP